MEDGPDAAERVEIAARVIGQSPERLLKEWIRAAESCDQGRQPCRWVPQQGKALPQDPVTTRQRLLRPVGDCPDLELAVGIEPTGRANPAAVLQAGMGTTGRDGHGFRDQNEGPSRARALAHRAPASHRSQGQTPGQDGTGQATGTSAHRGDRRRSRLDCGFRLGRGLPSPGRAAGQVRARSRRRLCSRCCHLKLNRIGQYLYPDQTSFAGTAFRGTASRRPRI